MMNDFAIAINKIVQVLCNYVSKLKDNESRMKRRSQKIYI